MRYEERDVDVWAAQYESSYRAPKNDTLIEIAKMLNINGIHLAGVTPDSAEDIMLTFLWSDEDNQNTFHLFRFTRNPGKCNASDDKSVHYYDNDEWPVHPPVDMRTDYCSINDFTREWCLRKEQLKNNEISEDEYMEWKLNWPAASSSIDESRSDKKNNSYKQTKI